MFKKDVTRTKHSEKPMNYGIKKVVAGKILHLNYAFLFWRAGHQAIKYLFCQLLSATKIERLNMMRIAQRNKISIITWVEILFACQSMMISTARLGQIRGSMKLFA